ncbi:MAG: AMMECR1 domain-containing protein [Candidatus Cloacimonas sp. 4484_275]|nr:MAG: AMMECR1 domain-containing protein [Candidatus Cloacimonas sp. 4484_275]
MLTSEQKRFLLRLARESIQAKLEKRKIRLNCPEEKIYHQKRGGFVTIHKNGKLRGCIGYVIPIKSLCETIKEMAIAAAFNDPRFSPLTYDELDKIEIEISVLSELIPVHSIDEIEVGRDGLLMKNGLYSGLLLPQVPIEWNWDKITFLEQTCLKAGLNSDCWKNSETEIYRFTAEVFSESK